MSAQEAPATVYLKDYRPPNYWARKVQLTIDLDPDATLISSKVTYEHQAGSPRNLRLHGKDLQLLSVAVNQQSRALDTLDWSPEHLFIDALPERCELELVTKICPRQNTALEGLYLSHSQFYTQCEPEGFRRLTYYLDRPDVMATFETTILAPKGKLPVLLSNGNLIEKGSRSDGKHFAVWHDPFPKPSYLFALVAGDLSCVADRFMTASGRTVAIHIYVEKENINKCSFALEAIKRAMRWDEEVYNLEYDLDLFMVVAVGDFNMGAMENKGLNIFNSKYVLASSETATDTDFENILGVVGHEFFHNWSGNRVTLRDWFQLSLKEGLTVFRDQQFSSDCSSASVKRIQDVKLLREHQFPEDSGPMAHPVRPESYIEINNFYTATIYNKGAEVIRMLHSIIGAEAFQKAMQTYFKTFDGQAVTIEDFLQVISSSTGEDLSQFKLWYHQAGTPRVEVRSEFRPQEKQMILHLRQEISPPTSPLLIPVRTAFISRQGQPLQTRVGTTKSHEHMLLLTQERQEFVFEEVTEDALPSVFRHFSAPVVVARNFSQNELYRLLASETDAFNKYETAQTLAQDMMQKSQKLPIGYIEALRTLLHDRSADPRLIAMAMQAPTLDYLVQQEETAFIEQLFSKRSQFLQQLATHLHDDLLQAYRRNHDPGSQALDSQAIGRRELKNCCLSLLAQLETEAVVELCKQQFEDSKTMTDTVAALMTLAPMQSPVRDVCLDRFYLRWKNDPLVVDKWFAIQASSFHPDVLRHVQALLKHPDFDILNPNRVYSIFRQFSRSNPYGFHHASGEGYGIVADYVLRIDQKNSQVAAMLASFLSRFRKFDPARQLLMRQQLEKIRAQKSLSRDVFEVVSKSLHS